MIKFTISKSKGDLKLTRLTKFQCSMPNHDYLKGKTCLDGRLKLSTVWDNRHLFVTEKYPGHGTLKLEDVADKISIKGNDELVFDLVRERSTFGWREGVLVYENKENDVELKIVEHFEWDEYE